MERYETYKPSGIEWIGAIPNQWKKTKLKYYFSFAKGANAAAYTNEYIGTHTGDFPVYSGQTDNDGILGWIDTYQYDFDSVLFVTTVGAKAMTLKQLYGKFSLSQNCALIVKKNDEIDERFYFYYLQKHFDYEKGRISLIMQPSLRFEDLNTYDIYIPSYTEQTAIGRYLDDKNEQIERLISNKQRLIEILIEERTAIINQAVTKGINPDVKLKPSGIDWLGDIPEHWKVKKLKYLVGLKSGENVTSDEIKDDGDFPVYGGNGLRGYFSSFTHEGNFILIGRQGALCGNVHYASGRFWASEHAIVVTRYEESELMWLGELLRTMNLNQYSQSAAQPGLAVDKIKNLSVPIPPADEQKEIANTIKHITETVDATISKIERETELMHEYRTALISEVVTGKLKVV